MLDECSRVWTAWRDSLMWPMVALATSVLLLLGALFGGEAVHGDTFSRALVVVGAFGAGYLVVSLPRRTLLLRVAAAMGADYLSRFHFATVPAHLENRPPGLIRNPFEFYAVHETLLLFIPLVVIAEVVGTWYWRPRGQTGVGGPPHAAGGWSSPSHPQRGEDPYGRS